MAEVETRHPSITHERQYEWDLMTHALAGEGDIKAKGERYLPKPSGFKALPDKGQEAYRAYRGRAQFPEIVAPSVAAAVGVIHSREIAIELPPGMEYLTEVASSDGLPLEAFHRRITRRLLTEGRYGVLADAPPDGGAPFLTGYTAQAVINWDDGFYVLDESHEARAGFVWRPVKRFRVLDLIDGVYVQSIWEGEDLNTPAEVLQPRSVGGRALDAIPFVVANARDIVPDVIPPPLVGVARAALAIYQLSADYRWQLYMSGQETLVAINGPAPEFVGAGVVHSMMGADGAAPDLRYVSPSCSGIDAHRIAMEENRKAAIMAGARLFEQQTVEESGEARRMRFASETATLLSVAHISCGVLERALRHVAVMLGQNPDAVVVTPPDDLIDRSLTPAEAQALVSVWQSGAIAFETLYDNLQRGGIASQERGPEDEMRLIDNAQIADAQPAPDMALETAAMPRI